MELCFAANRAEYTFQQIERVTITPPVIDVGGGTYDGTITSSTLRSEGNAYMVVDCGAAIPECIWQNNGAEVFKWTTVSSYYFTAVQNGIATQVSDTVMELYDANGILIAENDDNGSRLLSGLEVELASDSVYYIRMSAKYGQTGGYSLRINTTGLDWTPSLGTPPCYTHETNDSRTDSTAIGNFVTGLNLPSLTDDCTRDAGDVDWFSMALDPNPSWAF